MRYETIENITFTDITGKSIEIKDIRPYPKYQLMTSLLIKEEDQLDEIASRTGIYGEGSEDQYFKIMDFNIVKLFENNFDLSKLDRINIPLL